MLSPARPARSLRAGSTVSVILPASPLPEAWDLPAAMERVRLLGFEPKLEAEGCQPHGYLAGPDRARARALEAAIADPSTDAVFALRGGYGCLRLLPRLDWSALAASDKAIVGSSDLTALQNARLAMGGPVEWHAPMASSPFASRAAERLRRLSSAPAGGQVLSSVAEQDGGLEGPWRVATGHAEGMLLGGNLSVFTNLLGTPWLPDVEGCILALEDVGEATYRIDRMLAHLGLAGVLDRIAGLALGQFSRRPRGAQPRELSLAEVFEAHLAHLGVPVVFGFDFGHIPDSATLPLGARVRLDADAGTLALA